MMILLNLFALQAVAQSDSSGQKGIQVSLLTCGAGEEIYSVFGHTAVRIVDSSKGTDIVYNYGTFDGYDENFEMKFMRGKLLYYLSEERFADFIDQYSGDGRWVDEQILQAGVQEKQAIQSYILTNLRPENRAYKYDFFFDNCATRIRDIFSESGQGHFHYPAVLLPHAVTFREMINRYLAHHQWERFGINILLGSKIDAPMSTGQVMFLPDYLRDGVAGATLNGRPFAGKAIRIVDGEPYVAKNDPAILIVLYGLWVLLTIGLLVTRLRLLGLFLSNLILVLTGLLGVLILLMWFGTDHQGCSDNFNLLWALPTNLLYVFRKQQYKYALLALCLIGFSFVLHILNVQGLLLVEMLPVLGMLVLIFAFNYRKYKQKENGKNRTA